MPQHSLNCLRIDVAFVHHPGAQAVWQIVKTEPLTLYQNDASARGAHVYSDWLFFDSRKMYSWDFVHRPVTLSGIGLGLIQMIS
jgi:hypothetical protein